MKIAIMQPYVFPYIGYFQLIKASDVFVFYDDVNFPKKGFVNKNFLLINGIRKRFTIPCIAVSQNKKINSILVDSKSNFHIKLLRSIEQNYMNAPYFNQVYPLISRFFNKTSKELISDMAIDSISLVMAYLNLDNNFKRSSCQYVTNQHLQREERLLDIVKREGGSTYINAVGGKAIYTKEYFSKNDIDLFFLESNISEYKQQIEGFIPSLSIIDILMNNDKETIRLMLDDYKLI